MSSSRGVGRGVGAVVGGIMVGFALTVITDVVLHATGVFPPWGQPVGDRPLMLATLYRIIYGAVSGYVAARLAAEEPMRHALIVGGIGFVLSFVGALATWNK